MPGLSLYKTSWCSFCARVLSVIDELELPVELRDIDSDVVAREQLQAATGRTTVPCLRIESEGSAVTWMHESRDIIGYLREVAAA